VKVEKLELRLLKLPLVQFFETSFGRVYDKHFVLVRVEGDGSVGWGECVAEQDPYYSADTNDSVWHIASDFIVPRVVGASFEHPLPYPSTQPRTSRDALIILCAKTVHPSLVL